MSDNDSTTDTATSSTSAQKATKKVATKKATKKVATKKATTEKATTEKATTEKPVTKKATSKKTASKKVATKKATAEKSVTKKTAVKKSAAKKAATKPVSDVVAAEAAAAVPLDVVSPGGETSSDGSGAAAGTEGGRTRTRTRARARRTAGAVEGGPDAHDADGSVSDRAVSDADGNMSESDEPGATGQRRRRRGGRGRRGRGRGGDGAIGSDEGRDGAVDAEAGAKDDGEDDGAEGADRRGQSTRSETPGKRTKKASSRGSGAKKASRGRTPGADSEDDGDETSVARGGTRLAAKKSRRGAGQGGGQSGRGGGNRRGARPGGVTEEERRTIMAGPPRTMIVTARPERTQIAVMEDRTLVEHYVTRDEDVTFVGNIYMGRVQNVLPGMEAAFIDIGKGRNGVLYAGEVLYDEMDLEEESDQRIENVLKPGQKVLVQVTKDPMGTKGPRLTMHLSLAGRYVVLAPDSDLFGISRKLTDAERDRLRRIVKAAKPEGHGVIVRTAAEGATEEALTADVERLVGRWQKVEEAAKAAKPLDTVYEEPKLVVKVIRDIFGPDFVRCILDDDALYAQVHEYLTEVAPELVERVELYGAPTDDERSQAAGAPSLAAAEEAARAADGTGSVPEQPTPAERRRDLPALFTAFDVNDQLRQAMNRKVWLPSGGYLIIESTEAMKVIDVNTGRFTGGNDSNLEEVVLKTNLEAADEIVRQLRLRDMGGMVIIDFIDMLLRTNQEQVVRRLKRELLRDRTKTRVSDVSRLGLVQMTRKNVSQGLVESFSTQCTKCEGHGFVTNLT